MPTGRRWLHPRHVVAAVITGAVSLAVALGPSPPAWSAGTVTTTQLCARPGAVTVSTATGLTRALARAKPGQVIVIQAGTYAGSFTAATPALPKSPITVCGRPGAVLSGGSTGNTLHLLNAHWWVVTGLTVVGGQKGVVLDATQHAALIGLTVTDTQDEAIHLRTGSSDNLVRQVTVDRTGRGQARFGEGIYIGSAQSNWCRYTGCAPDASDRNVIQGCRFGPGITAENIDIKEGTVGGVVEGCAFDGSGATAVDSWVDVKGNGWTVRANTGTHAPHDGAQVHVQGPGWGRDNTFTGNRFVLGANGYGVWVQPGASGNVVSCDNVVLQSGGGRSNLRCVSRR